MSCCAITRGDLLSSFEIRRVHKVCILPSVRIELRLEEEWKRIWSKHLSLNQGERKCVLKGDVPAQSTEISEFRQSKEPSQGEGC